MESREALLHIGLHKTGTTALQTVLGANRALLRAQGVDFYTGVVKPNNHVELMLATLCGDVETFGRLRYGGRADTAPEAVAARVRAFVAESPCDRIMFSNEGLSLLRSPEECRALRALIGPDHRYRVILTLRDRESFLASYRDQLFKTPGRRPSSDSRSALYVEPDTWLLDFDALLAAYRAVFEDVVVLDYDHRIVPRILDVVGVRLPASALAVTANPRSRPNLGLLRRIGRTLRRVARV